MATDARLSELEAMSPDERRQAFDDTLTRLENAISRAEEVFVELGLLTPEPKPRHLRLVGSEAP
jgi:hypothetical protein